MFSLPSYFGLSLAYVYALLSIACTVLASSILVPFLLERLQAVRKEQQMQQRLQKSADIQIPRSELGVMKAGMMFCKDQLA